MAIIYLRSTNGSDSNDGSTWSLAKATLVSALTAAGEGGTVYVSQTHSETQSSNMILTSPGTAASPCKIICCSDANEPPTTLATTATVTVSTAGGSISFLGFTYLYGVSFLSNGVILFTGTSPSGYILDNCILSLYRTTAAHAIQVGSSISSNDDTQVILKDTILKFSNIGNSITPKGARFTWMGGSLGLGSSSIVPTTLIVPYTGFCGTAKISGVDLSNLGSGTSLVKSDIAAPVDIAFSNCKLSESVSVISGTILGPGGVSVYLDNCDSGDPSSGPRSEVYTYQGSVKTDTAKYRSGGASDGTSYSLIITANTTGVSFISPLVTRPIPKAIDTVGSEITVTAHIAMEEGATPLTESQCWMEVEYMGTSGSTLTSFLTDNNSTVISESSTAQETSTETWTGFTGTPVKQKLSVAFTPQEKGFYMVRIYLARVSAETTAPPVYVCPKLAVS